MRVQGEDEGPWVSGKRVWGGTGCVRAGLGRSSWAWLQTQSPGGGEGGRGCQLAVRLPPWGLRLLLRAAAGQGKPAELRRRQKEAKKATGRATRWRKESGAPLSCLPLTSLPLLTLVSPFVRGS